VKFASRLIKQSILAKEENHDHRQNTQKLLADSPDEAGVTVYEGERIGITIRHGNMIGWIETGMDDKPADDAKNQLPLRKLGSAKSE
jgi:hypothetical protein